MNHSSIEELATQDELQQDEGKDEDGQVDAIDFELVSLDEPNSPRNLVTCRNQFAHRQNFVRQLCDASLLAANVSQLRTVLDNGPGNAYFIPLLIMIAMVIVCHVLFGFLMIQRWRKEREAQLEHKMIDGRATMPKSEIRDVNPQGNLCFCTSCVTVERYDDVSMYFMLLVVILNVGIAGLGLSGPEKGSI